MLDKFERRRKSAFMIMTGDVVQSSVASFWDVIMSQSNTYYNYQHPLNRYKRIKISFDRGILHKKRLRNLGGIKTVSNGVKKCISSFFMAGVHVLSSDMTLRPTFESLD